MYRQDLMSGTACGLPVLKWERHDRNEYRLRIFYGGLTFLNVAGRSGSP